MGKTSLQSSILTPIPQRLNPNFIDNPPPPAPVVWSLWVLNDNSLLSVGSDVSELTAKMHWSIRFLCVWERVCSSEPFIDMFHFFFSGAVPFWNEGEVFCFQSVYKKGLPWNHVCMSLLQVRVFSESCVELPSSSWLGTLASQPSGTHTKRFDFHPKWFQRFNLFT